MDMDGIKWLFFDMGSTLLDETGVYEDIFHKIAVAANVSEDLVKEKATEFYKQNKKGDKEVVKIYGIESPKWNPGLERVYGDTEAALIELKKKYKIGIIANQMYGSEGRLENFGIRKYLDVIVASAEEGVEKPDRRIFDIALERAGCKPSEAVMIGDRIDNDIVPAKKLGMKTVWIKQGFGRYWKLEGKEQVPDYEVDSLMELVDILKV